jgi:hypothetical protein
MVLYVIMKPSGVLTESKIDTGTNEQIERATLVMSPDEERGCFLGATGVFSVSNRVEVGIIMEDALKFKTTKSEKVRQQIIDSYVLKDSDGSDRYQFPYGAILGGRAVGAVLEIKGSIIRKH